MFKGTWILRETEKRLLSLKFEHFSEENCLREEKFESAYKLGIGGVSFCWMITLKWPSSSFSFFILSCKSQVLTQITVNNVLSQFEVTFESIDPDDYIHTNVRSKGPIVKLHGGKISVLKILEKYRLNQCLKMICQYGEYRKIKAI